MTNIDLIAQHLFWCRRIHLRDATITHRHRVLRRIGLALPEPFQTVTTPQLANWQLGLNRAPWTEATYLMHVRSFYTWMVDNGHRDDNPAAKLRRPKIRKGLPRPISEDDLRTALACAPEPMRTWLLLAAYAGLRCMEIVNLTPDDIRTDTTPALLMVRDGKGGKDRIVPIGPHLVAALRPHLATRGPIWRTRSGSPVRRDYMSTLISRHLHSIGLPYTAHSMRHRYGTRLYQLSGDLRMVGDVMGHGNVGTTAIYTAWSQDRATTAVGKLDALIPA